MIERPPHKVFVKLVNGDEREIDYFSEFEDVPEQYQGRSDPVGVWFADVLKDLIDSMGGAARLRWRTTKGTTLSSHSIVEMWVETQASVGSGSSSS